MDAGAILQRVLERPRVVTARRVLDVYGQAPGGLLANGLAFVTLFATFPVALVTLGVAGWLVDDPAVQGEVAQSIGRLLPPLQDLIDDALRTLSQGALLTSVVGVVGLLWTVSQLYVTLDVAFARIFTERPERDVLRRQIRGFAWVVALVATVVLLFIGGSLAAAADALLLGSGTTLGAINRLLSSLPIVTAIVIAIVGLVYRVLPPHAPRWGAIALPAVATGVAVVALSQAFLFLVPRLFGAAFVTGPLATAFVALAWLSFTFQAVLLGAAWVRVREGDARGLTD